LFETSAKENVKMSDLFEIIAKDEFFTYPTDFFQQSEKPWAGR